MLPRTPLHRSHLAQRRRGAPGPRHRDDGGARRQRDRLRHLSRDGATTSAKLAYHAVGAWLEGTAPLPADGGRRAPGSRSSCALQDRVAQAMKSLRHQQGALSLETIETRAVFDGDALADLRPDEKNRAKELIEDFMIAANGVTAQVPRGQGPFRRCGACCAHRSAGSASSSWPRGSARRCPARRAARRSSGSWPRASKADPAALSRSLALRRQAAGQGRVRGASVPGQAGRALRPRRARLLAFHRAQPPLSRPASRSGCSRRRWPAGPRPTPTRSSTPLAQHCTAQEDNATKVGAAGAEVGGGAAARRRGSASASTRMVTGASAKGTWVRILRPPVEGKAGTRRGGPGRGRPRARRARLDTDVERGFIDFGSLGRK